MRRHICTKIVCTIGPASRDPDMLRRLIQAGMDVARLNFSHADQAYHGESISRVRAAAESMGKSVAVLADLQGPKLRIGRVPDPGIPIHNGERVILSTEEVMSRQEESSSVAATIPIQYKNLPAEITLGETILIDDGLIELKVLEAGETGILCEVIDGGVVYSNKGMNLPGAQLSIPAFTEKDRFDLDFALSRSVDWVALSFVRTAKDVEGVKTYIAERCGAECPTRVIAKIEKPQALAHIDEIIAVADGIMVARGDLGIEISLEQVPVVQKRLIQAANRAGKSVITATQMLESMIHNPRPTRAEVTDVANAILDGTDAIMLSGETAMGQFPAEAVEMMARIAAEVEAATRPECWAPPSHVAHIVEDVTDAVSQATCETAYNLGAAAIITATASGKTARAVARYRPLTPVIAVTPSESVQRQLMLDWGIIPLLGHRAESTDRVLRDSVQAAFRAGLVREGDKVVLTAGVANNLPGVTNLMTVEQVRVEDLGAAAGK